MRSIGALRLADMRCLERGAGPARSLGIGESAVRRYLDLFTSLLVVRQLQPWHENLSKRQVKAPKAYIRNSGLPQRRARGAKRDSKA